LSRVTAPTDGNIDLYGRVASMLEVGTGFNGEMTGRENVYLNGAILGMSKAEIDAKMDDIIDFSEVREFIDTPVKRYSSGMYVKLAFSVAAHLDSEIMIMDEVLAVGDVAFQKKCLNKMRSVATDEGRTVLYVSHNMNTIRTLCDRCIVLEQGKIIFDGDVEEAIRIYSSGKNLEQKNEHDVSQIKRIGDINMSGVCRLNKIRIKETNLQMDHPLEFQLEISSKRKINNSMIRVVVFNQVGEVIGMTFSEQYLLESGDNVITYTLDTKGLVAGIYTCDLMLLEYSDSVNLRHDYVPQKLTFTIEETIRYFDGEWNQRYWGNIKFNDIKVLQANNLY